VSDSADSWIQVHDDRSALGAAAAADIAAELRRLLASQGGVRMVFAAAPSQQETLTALIRAPDVDWSRVTAFHMDEYLGLPATAPERFGNWLQRTVFDLLPFGAVHLIGAGDQADADAAVRRYTDLLAAAPIDLVCLGIGVNGHIAFNDPPVADFTDPLTVKVVQLDDLCRQQQVDDDCFATLAQVPTRAVTLTVPALLAAPRLFCAVPAAAKAQAVRETVYGRLGTHCPSTILRTHPGCTMYLDQQSAALLCG
jgi:glucosamine-6-phosphate deaminase